MNNIFESDFKFFLVVIGDGTIYTHVNMPRTDGLFRKDLMLKAVYIVLHSTNNELYVWKNRFGVSKRNISFIDSMYEALEIASLQQKMTQRVEHYGQNILEFFNDE